MLIMMLSEWQKDVTAKRKTSKGKMEIKKYVAS
jgi:hypothetical protein